MKKAYAILRVGKLSVQELPAAVAHNQREVQPTNADSNRARNNIDFLAHDKRSVLTRWEERMKECRNPKVRSNAVAAVELFMGFSPEATWIDPVQWGKDCVAFVSNIFGEKNSLSLVVHLDERTPHCSTLTVPLVQKSVRGGELEWRLSASHWTDGPAKLRALQSLFWEQVGAKHGLERGEEGSARKHVPQSAMYANSNAVASVVADAVQSIPPANLGETESDKITRIKKHLEQNLGALAEAAKQTALLQSINRAASASELKRRKETERRKKAEEEKQRVEETANRLKQEFQDRLRDLPVSLVLQKVLGVQPHKEGQNKIFETPGLKISVHPDDRRFMVFRGNKPGGSGAISAVMQVMDCDFRQAIRWLGAGFGVSEIESSMRYFHEHHVRQNAKEAVGNPVTAQEKLAKYAPIVEATWPLVRQYLVHTRCLPGSWIDSLHRRGDLWSNDHGSACFAHRNMTGSIVGASIRGTSAISKFHQTVGNKADGFFRYFSNSISPKRIAVVESPIEAISLAVLESSARTLYASTAGAGGIISILDVARESGWKVIAAQNDDAAGEVQARYTADLCSTRGLPCIRMRPAFCDWNDTLRGLHHDLLRTQQSAESISSRLRAAWSQKANSHRIDLQAKAATAIVSESTASQYISALFPESTTTQDTTITL